MEGNTAIANPVLYLQAASVKIKGRPLLQAESMAINPKWLLGTTGDGSRYWIHPDSGKVVPIVEK